MHPLSYHTLNTDCRESFHGCCHGNHCRRRHDCCHGSLHGCRSRHAERRESHRDDPWAVLGGSEVPSRRRTEVQMPRSWRWGEGEATHPPSSADVVVGMAEAAKGTESHAGEARNWVIDALRPALVGARLASVSYCKVCAWKICERKSCPESGCQGSCSSFRQPPCDSFGLFARMGH